MPGIAPEEHEPRNGDRKVDERQPERDVSRRQHRDGEREREPDTRLGQAGEGGRGRQPDCDAVRIEGQQRRRQEHERGGKSRVGGTLANPAERDSGSLLAPSLGLVDAAPELGRETLRVRAFGRVDRERAIDGLRQRPREIRPRRCERRRPTADEPCRLDRRRREERLLAGKRLPEDDADGPDVGRTCRFVARQPLGGDVGERPGDIAGRRQRVGVVEQRQPEVEQAYRHLTALDEQQVRRLDVPVHDSSRVRVGKRVEHLRGGLDGAPVVEHPVPDRLAQRAARRRTRTRRTRVARRGRRRRRGRNSGGGAGRRQLPPARRGRPPCPPSRRP